MELVRSVVDIQSAQRFLVKAVIHNVCGFVESGAIIQVHKLQLQSHAQNHLRILSWTTMLAQQRHAIYIQSYKNIWLQEGQIRYFTLEISKDCRCKLFECEKITNSRESWSYKSSNSIKLQLITTKSSMTVIIQCIF